MVFQLLRSSALEMVVLTFIIALGAILLGANQGLQKNTYSTDTITNETINFAVNNTAYATAHTPVVSIIRIGNISTTLSDTPSGGNYSFNTSGVYLYTHTGLVAVGSYNVSYTFTNEYTYESNITGAGVVALSTYSNYFGILVIAIIFVAIIGIILIVAGSAKTKV